MSDSTPNPTPKPAVKPKSPVAERKPRAPRKAPTPEPVSRTSPLGLVLLVAALIVAVDQALKYLVVQVLRLHEVYEIDVFDPWLNLRMAWNQGVNFGLFSSEENITRWVLIAVALAICVWVIVWMARGKPGRLAQISAGLLIGGAIGNVIDRVVYGAVADFLNMSLPNWRNPFSFNVADIAIFAGALGLFLQPPTRTKTVEPPVTAAKRTRGKASDKTRDEAEKSR